MLKPYKKYAGKKLVNKRQVLKDLFTKQNCSCNSINFTAQILNVYTNYKLSATRVKCSSANNITDRISLQILFRMYMLSEAL